MVLSTRAVRCQIESLILRVSLARDPRGLAPDLASLIPRVTPSANPRYHESIGFSDDGDGAVSAGEGGGWDVFLYRGDGAAATGAGVAGGAGGVACGN